MSLDHIDMLAPIIACTIIIAMHWMQISVPNRFKSDHTLEHRCIICAYLIFMLHYLLELAPGRL